LRTFASPVLEAGKDFSYTLKAELVVDGQTVTATKVVNVRAGQVARETLTFPTAGVVQK